MNTTNLQQQIEATARELGVELKRSAADVAVYAAGRAAHLAAIAGQAGFAEAVVAERDSVCLFAGISTARAADAADHRLVGLLQGALAFGVVAAG